ncbi:MAG: hypothetical protein M0Z36_08840 [Thermaerobacter sp.]|nr:hypothetical protein [Thermaerobacter sp.]
MAILFSRDARVDVLPSGADTLGVRAAIGSAVRLDLWTWACRHRGNVGFSVAGLGRC